ncbi:aldose epimerase family protein [Bacillus sp. 1NLA3E]|uniref:aldose epimerase family protein n=1 Tax=Bacillus sp. 1NLA3E TaxID=666686 RepID=UPI000247F00C|nr:aldose epimerase family protein [Bacillus sp. 1NLA3E]AGK53964.1 aldose 1-epimerase [Bacillus sp. 1NLA3E]
MKVTKDVFGEVDCQVVKSYQVRTDNGMEFTCIDYGCTITKIVVPDKNGIKENVVLGFDTIEEYLNFSAYFGSVIGRISGRIKNAVFTLNGETFKLAENDNGNNLHGGPHGFNQVIWNSSIEEKKDVVNITFTYTSLDGEEGFPGTLKVKVRYTIKNDNEIIISYQAISDKKTIVNLTNHSYFNLSGDLKRNILTHEVTLKSDSYLELDDQLLPTGTFLPVENTVFDFRNGQQVLQGVNSGHPQTKIVGNGFDHPFLLNTNNDQEISLVDHESGRKLVIETDQPCVVFYSGNALNNKFKIRGVQSVQHLGLCLETQIPPNMIDHPNFLSAILEANELYSTKTKYAFGIV